MARLSRIGLLKVSESLGHQRGTAQWVRCLKCQIRCRMDTCRFGMRVPWSRPGKQRKSRISDAEARAENKALNLISGERSEEICGLWSSRTIRDQNIIRKVLDRSSTIIY